MAEKISVNYEKVILKSETDELAKYVQGDSGQVLNQQE